MSIANGLKYYDDLGIIIQISFYDKRKWGWDIVMQDTGLSINADSRFYDHSMAEYYNSREDAVTVALIKAELIKQMIGK